MKYMVIVSRVNRSKALDSNKNTVILFVDIRIVNFIVSPMVDYLCLNYFHSNYHYFFDCGEVKALMGAMLRKFLVSTAGGSGEQVG
ncbi:hypothetical protein [Vibrio splendidus]|uniref:hypothetical protein n=1 Tax=Vibrio splendidus TaxID=29497 RepID=UPI0011455F91|nr:hypothetical protein [Vibrio splendidus]